MGYPIYKLLRAVNRQYPNNGFIDYVDVREDMYNDRQGQLIDEDLRDLINETLQEVYIHVAKDEVYSFPTVAGQNQYALPEDCDLRDVQEVTRTFGIRPWGPPPPDAADMFVVTFNANGGEGYMEAVPVHKGDTFTFPVCLFTPPEGETFACWKVYNMEDEATAYNPGDTITIDGSLEVVAEWLGDYTFTILNQKSVSVNISLTPIGGTLISENIEANGGTYTISVESGKSLSDYYSEIMFYYYYVDDDQTHYEYIVPLNSTTMNTPIIEDTTYTLEEDDWR